MKDKKLSIIIPVYNVEKYISDSLNSIISVKKGLDDWLEIILVDDGSIDSSGSICDQYAEKYSFIKVIHQNNQGQSVARNIALNIASGEWITFVDSDDMVRSDYLTILLNNIQNNCQADIIMFKFNMFSDKDSIQKKVNETIPYTSEKISEISKSTAMYYLMDDEIGNYMWNKIFKRRLFNDIKFPAGRRFEDIAVLYKCFQLANKIFLYDDYLYFYRQHIGSTLHIKAPLERVDLLKESIQARKDQLNFFDKHKYVSAYNKAKSNYMTDEVFYIVWINKYGLPKDKIYSEAQKFIKSYKPKINEGKKFYFFIKIYSAFPKLVEKSIKLINRRKNEKNIE